MDISVENEYEDTGIWKEKKSRKGRSKQNKTKKRKKPNKANNKFNAGAEEKTPETSSQNKRKKRVKPKHRAVIDELRKQFPDKAVDIIESVVKRMKLQRFDPSRRPEILRELHKEEEKKFLSNLTDSEPDDEDTKQVDLGSSRTRGGLDRSVDDDDDDDEVDIDDETHSENGDSDVSESDSNDDNVDRDKLNTSNTNNHIDHSESDDTVDNDDDNDDIDDDDLTGMETSFDRSVEELKRFDFNNPKTMKYLDEWIQQLSSNDDDADFVKIFNQVSGVEKIITKAMEAPVICRDYRHKITPILDACLSGSHEYHEQLFDQLTALATDISSSSATKSSEIRDIIFDLAIRLVSAQKKQSTALQPEMHNEAPTLPSTVWEQTYPGDPAHKMYEQLDEQAKNLSLVYNKLKDHDIQVRLMKPQESVTFRATFHQVTESVNVNLKQLTHRQQQLQDQLRIAESRKRDVIDRANEQIKPLKSKLEATRNQIHNAKERKLQLEMELAKLATVIQNLENDEIEISKQVREMEKKLLPSKSDLEDGVTSTSFKVAALGREIRCYNNLLELTKQSYTSLQQWSHNRVSQHELSQNKLAQRYLEQLQDFIVNYAGLKKFFDNRLQFLRNQVDTHERNQAKMKDMLGPQANVAEITLKAIDQHRQAIKRDSKTVNSARASIIKHLDKAKRIVRPNLFDTFINELHSSIGGIFDLTKYSQSRVQNTNGFHGNDYHDRRQTAEAPLHIIKDNNSYSRGAPVPQILMHPQQHQHLIMNAGQTQQHRLSQNAAPNRRPPMASLVQTVSRSSVPVMGPRSQTSGNSTPVHGNGNSVSQSPQHHMQHMMRHPPNHNQFPPSHLMQPFQTHQMTNGTLSMATMHPVPVLGRAMPVQQANMPTQSTVPPLSHNQQNNSAQVTLIHTQAMQAQVPVLQGRRPPLSVNDKIQSTDQNINVRSDQRTDAQNASAPVPHQTNKNVGSYSQAAQTDGMVMGQRENRRRRRRDDARAQLYSSQH